MNCKQKSPNRIAPARADELYEQILRTMIVDKKYRDHSFSARQLARQLNTNSRQLALIFSKRFHANYSTVVNRLRVTEAMNILADSRYEHLRIAEVGEMVGFSNRQSFYSAFDKIAGTSPRAYRMAHLEK